LAITRVGAGIAPDERMARQSRFWLTCVLVVLLCNAVDAAVTLCAIEFGDATEANPLMAVLLGAGTLPFVVVKHTLVSLGLVLLWRLRARPLARGGAVLAMSVYPLLLVYEIWSC
jgi:hypothetical protein